MPILFVSLGTSPAIVPEAFLLPGVEFDAVHVLTTDSTDVELVTKWFAENASRVVLSITRVHEFRDFCSEQDHFRFEEVLYRWMLEVAASLLLAGGESPTGTLEGTGSASGTLAATAFVCLTGGFKTMSAAMQKAAAVLGAAEVFHVLCNLPNNQQPKTAEGIAAAHAAEQLRWICLGAESGWPQFYQDAARDYPLTTLRKEGSIRWVEAPDMRFRERLREIVERSHRIAGTWDQLATLPFQTLATWSSADLEWLRESLNPDADREWVAALPKIELHCHLGGFATHGSLLREVHAAADQPASLPPLEEPALPAGWPMPTQPISLEDYRKLGDANGSALLRDRGCLRRQCKLLYEHLVEQNVVYAEIRCSPANYADPERGRSPWEVLSEIRCTFEQCMVAASVPLAETVAASVPVDVSAATRAFVPYNQDTSYTQTWRDLPHRHQQDRTVFATFRLADSIPKERLRIWEEERNAFVERHPRPWTQKIWEEYHRQFPRRLEAWLDEAHGSCLLGDPEMAVIVEGALRYFDNVRYVLDEFVVMPNHVHVLFKPIASHELDEIMHSWKSFTAHVINERLGHDGPVWQHESFDHLVRSREQLERLRAYIAANPEMAGLRSGFIVGRGMGLICAGQNEAVARVSSVGNRPTGTVAPTGSSARGPHVNLILIGTRQEAGAYRAGIARHLALAVAGAEHWTSGCRVVGVDLAGYEDASTRAHYFREEFAGVHRCGLALTVHAGENDEAEGVWRAVFDLNARRLGHALHLVDSPELMRSVADRGIGIEMCPYANLQIKGFALDRSGGRDHLGCSVSPQNAPASQRLAPFSAATGTVAATSSPTRRYPLDEYLKRGIRVTVNTDNIGISGASLTDNLLLAAKLCPGLTRMDVLRLQRNAIDTAFLSPASRAEILKDAEVRLPFAPKAVSSRSANI